MKISSILIRSNCQDDKGFSLLQDVFDMYDLDFEENEDGFEDDEDIIELDLENGEEIFNFLCDEALVFDSAKVCRNVLLSTKCIDCKNTFEAHCPLSGHGILKKCDTEDNRIFTYPTVLFMAKFKLLFKKVQTVLPFICHEKLLSKKLITYLDNETLEGLGCYNHRADISEKIKKETVKLNIEVFRKEINNILVKKNLEPLENQHDIYNKAFKAQKKGAGKHESNV